MSMDESKTAAESSDQAAKSPGLGTKVGRAVAECWNARESLWVGLIVFTVGVLGQILLYTVPSEEFYASYANFQLHGSLTVCAEAAMYLGVVWVGVYLARWGLMKKKH